MSVERKKLVLKSTGDTFQEHKVLGFQTSKKIEGCKLGKKTSYQALCNQKNFLGSKAEVGKLLRCTAHFL